MTQSAKTAVILSASGGIAHQLAAEIVNEELEQQGYKTTHFNIHDSTCFVFPAFGRFSAHMWDAGQRDGNVGKQFLLGKMHPLCEFLFYIPSTLTLVNLLTKKLPNTERVIATSPIFLSAMCNAVMKANLDRPDDQKIQHIELYMVEPPTDEAIYYLGPLKKLNKKKRALIKLYAIRPNAKDLEAFGNSEEKFWLYKTGLSLEKGQVIYDPAIKKPFKTMVDLPKPQEKCELSLKASDFPLENDFLKKLSLKHSNICPRGGNQFAFDISTQDKVGLIMLGSNPTRKAILDYVDAALSLLTHQIDPLGKNFLFISCGLITQKRSLYEEVLEKIEHIASDHLIIVPFTRQPIERIFARSDLSLTRSGGMTSQEILALKTHSQRKDPKKILLHAEIKETFSSFQEIAQRALKVNNEDLHTVEDNVLENAVENYLIKQGIPLWEGGNAHYLKNAIENISIVTPQLIKAHFEEIFLEQASTKRFIASC